MVQDFGYVNLTSLLTPHIIWNSSLFPFYVLTFADLGEVEDEIFKKRRDDDVCFRIFYFLENPSNILHIPVQNHLTY